MASEAAKAPGELNLTVLFATLETVLHPDTFVFITLVPGQNPPPGLFIQMSFRETEGLTIISTEASAQSHGLEYTFLSRMITLNVHSSLEAVGFIAAIGKRLTERKMGVNPVSGYFHDHLFVPLGREEEALQVLKEMAAEAKSEFAK